MSTEVDLSLGFPAVPGTNANNSGEHFPVWIQYCQVCSLKGCVLDDLSLLTPQKMKNQSGIKKKGNREYTNNISY